MRQYHYSEGNGPFFIWGEAGRGRAVSVHRTGRLAQMGVFFDGATVGLLSAGASEDLRMPKDAETVYTDRLYQWDADKHDALCMKHFGDEGQHWEHRSPEAVSAFLSDYLGEPVKAITLWQYNNASSGYPVWLIFYRKEAQS